MPQRRERLCCGDVIVPCFGSRCWHCHAKRLKQRHETLFEHSRITIGRIVAHACDRGATPPLASTIGGTDRSWIRVPVADPDPDAPQYTTCCVRHTHTRWWHTSSNADGAAHDLRTGDAFHLPKGWSGTWEVVEDMRKFYVILP